MRLADYLDIDCVRVGLSAPTKRQLLQQLASLAGECLALAPEPILAALLERERHGSTGFGNGVAIPHGKLDGLDRIHCVVARLAAPVDFEAIDGNPVDLAFMLLSPPDAGAEHLKALAALSRLLRHSPTLDKLRGARNRDALGALLLQGIEERDAA